MQSHNIAYADTPSRQLLLDREATPYFLDVPEDHPDFRYIQALTHAGYVEIPAERLFQPDLILTRVLLIDWKVQLDWQGAYRG
ncbi:MAG: S-layer homology domain-containing protein [Synechococcaceae cyanobacterium SM2_3_60]|nr:S-layer homology domain-containing protein [Synechococcaceae cyanobacterium SM2_3_60]